MKDYQIIVWQFEKNGYSVCKNDPCNRLPSNPGKERNIISTSPGRVFPQKRGSFARARIRITGFRFRAMSVVNIFTSSSFKATIQNRASSIRAFLSTSSSSALPITCATSCFFESTTMQETPDAESFWYAPAPTSPKPAITARAFVQPSALNSSLSVATMDSPLPKRNRDVVLSTTISSRGTGINFPAFQRNGMIMPNRSNRLRSKRVLKAASHPKTRGMLISRAPDPPGVEDRG